MCRHTGLGGRLYDPAPLLAYVAHLSTGKAAQRLEIHHSQLVRYRTGQRWLQYNTADRLAITIDRLACNVWADFGEPCCEENRRAMSSEAQGQRRTQGRAQGKAA